MVVSKRRLRDLATAVFVAGCVVALWPLGQTAYGVWSQRALQAQWRAEPAVPALTVKAGAATVPQQPDSLRGHGGPSPLSQSLCRPWPTTADIPRHAAISLW